MKKTLVISTLLLSLGACSTSGNIVMMDPGSKIIDRRGQTMTFLSKREVSGEACRWAFFGGDMNRERNSVVTDALGNAIAGYAEKHENKAHPDALVNVSVKTSMRTWVPGVATHVCTDLKGVPVAFGGEPNRLAENTEKKVD